jgi:heme exporter protein C
MKRILPYVFAVLAAFGLLILPTWVFERAPLDYMLYINQKIFYYHVPAAMMMFLAAFVCGGASVVFLAKRKAGADDVAAAAGDLVVIFGLIVLVTGPIWANAAWGVPWVWEARLTSALVMWLIFVAYSLVRRYGGPGSERLGAGLAVFGAVNVPLVYFAVNFWKTQHPTNKVVPGLEGDMRIVFYLGLLSFLFLFLLLLAVRTSIGRAERRLAAAHDLAALNGHLD